MIVLWDPATNTVTPLDVPNPTGGALRLHDVATVDGRVTILYQHGPAACDAQTDECDVTLRTFEPDTGRSTELLSLDGSRNSWTNLSLADTGVIVGELSGADGTTFHSSVVGPDVVPDPIAGLISASHKARTDARTARRPTPSIEPADTSLGRRAPISSWSTSGARCSVLSHDQSCPISK